MQKWFSAPMQKHVVAYYPSEQVLAESLCDYVQKGIMAGDNCLVITKMSVAKHLHRMLSKKQVASSSYTILAADSVLEDFLIDGMPDKRAFFQRINKILSQSTKRGRPLRIYGDMVALLQEQGNAPAATALEKLWNELAKTHSFSLYCAYPARLFQNDKTDRTKIDSHHDIHELLRA